MSAAKQVTKFIPKATGEDADNGWTYDPKFLRQISSELELTHETLISLESIEAVLQSFIRYLIYNVD